MPLPNSNADLNPNEVKWDVILNFLSKYTSTGSTLALEAHIKTWTKVAPDASNAFITFFGNATAAGSFSWAPNATDSNGNVIRVIASPVMMVKFYSFNK